MKFLIIPVLVGIFSLDVLLIKPKPVSSSLNDLEEAIRYTTKIAEFDKARQVEKSKIIQISERFNPQMPDQLRAAIAEEIYAMSIKYPNLDVDLICATITHESARSWEPTTVSPAGAMGLMQVMPRTGKWLARYEDFEWTNEREILFNPIYNIRLGCRYLSRLIESYDVEGGLAAYNGGSRLAERWLARNKAEGILWDETQSYIPNVLKLYDEFKSHTL